MHIAFVLVRPEHPGNIGSAARAMKTMGFTDLRLVAPEADLNDPQGRWMAHSSEELLDHARIVPTVAEAVADIDVVIGTTVRHRSPRLPLIDASELPALLEAKEAAASTAAVVFGPERSGLTIEDVTCCDVLSSVPMAVRQPPLNLAQAVMVYAYVLSSTGQLPVRPSRADGGVRLAALKRRVDEILVEVGFEDNVRLRRRMAAGLARLGYADLGLLHQLSNRLADILELPEADEEPPAE